MRDRSRWRGSVRRLGLDGNPMRRTVDRIEAAVRIVLATAFLAVAGTAAARPRVEARWSAPDGSSRTGDVPAPWGLDAGGTTTIWIDDSGRWTDSPLHRSQLVGNGITATVLILAAFAVTALIAGHAVSLLLDRIRMAGWEAAWSTVEPHWTGRRPRR